MAAGGIIYFKLLEIKSFIEVLKELCIFDRIIELD
jgi:hypothetical protein